MSRMKPSVAHALRYLAVFIVVSVVVSLALAIWTEVDEGWRIAASTAVGGLVSALTVGMPFTRRD